MQHANTQPGISQDPSPQHPAPAETTPVLIVGGSLVGLSAALFLAYRGVPAILLEKHQGSAAHPRATGFTERSLEHFRAVGIGDQIPQVAPGMRLRRVVTESLTAPWQEETQWTPGERGERSATASPCTGAAIAQDKVEPILREAARVRGAELRAGHEACDVRRDGGGVTVTVRRREDGALYAIRAGYLIAADGADSPIRETLGIARVGVGHLRTLRSVLFTCPQAQAYLARGVQQFDIRQDGFKAFMTSYGDGRWVLMFDDDQERGEPELAAALRRALGADMAFEILATGRWEMAGRIAQRYSEGRIFLAGDSAHQLPPTRGGFGANTGIDDAWNLAWKLQWVLEGRSHPRLLDTYSDERQPIGWLRHQQTFARPDYAAWTDGSLAGSRLYGNEAMELGQLQRSTAVLGAGPDLPPAAHPDAWAGQPGTRAPHVWVRRGDATVSTLDLFGRGFVLLSEDADWIGAAGAVANNLGIAMAPLHVGSDVVFPSGSAFTCAFGIGPHGATLVRPDGLVCWRTADMEASPALCLRDALLAVAALVPGMFDSNKRDS